MRRRYKKEQRAKVRIGVTIQLVRGEDDDLIDAIAAIPEGQRQAAIKSLLRQSYGLPIPKPSSNGSHVDLDALRQELYQELMVAMEHKLTTPRVPPAPPPIEAGDQIDSQTAKERKSRLSKANW